MLERSATVPGVESVALTDFLPVTFGGSPTGYQVEGGEALADADGPSTLLARVTPGYFQTFRIPLLRGRDFEEADREGTRLVAVVNETLAQRSWPGADPLGRRIRLEELDDVELEVVGVARNAKYRSLTEDPQAMVYVPYEQWPAASMVMMARLTREDTDVANAFRAIVAELDANAPIDTNNPYSDLMGIANASQPDGGHVRRDLRCRRVRDGGPWSLRRAGVCGSPAHSRNGHPYRIGCAAGPGSRSDHA